MEATFTGYVKNNIINKSFYPAKFTGMKKIMIAIDYSPAAQKIAETGFAVAKGLNAELAIVHVITEAAFYAMDYSPIMGYKGGYTEGAVQVVEDITKEAENFLAATINHLGDPTIMTRVLQGDTKQAIIDCSKEWNADLIVLGSHSHHGLERLFSTDLASYMLNHSKVALLAIPTEDEIA